MSMLDPNFFPTPKSLIAKMWAKVKDPQTIKAVLEPSAGKGDIVEYLTDNADSSRYCRNPKISAIEQDDDLFATLLGKDINVVDRDFLNYNGGDIFDLIIMNPPFDHGDKHLLKAIDILYSGQIVCLLNAETIKHPYTRLRQELVTKLDKLGADIEYLSGEFQSAERKTHVEVALVHIQIDKNIEDDLLQGATDTVTDETVELEANEDANIAIRNSIHNLELEYQLKKTTGLEVIRNFYTHYRKVSGFIELSVKDERSHEKLHDAMQAQVNELNRNLRKHYWDKALALPQVKERMTSTNRNRFYSQLRQHSTLEFTANNVRSFVVNLIGGYEQTLIDAAVELFDDLTSKYSYWRECDKNKLHFSTWKTNEAWKVAKKVIIPFNSGYGRAFYNDYSGECKLDWQVRDRLNDIDKVLNYIAGHQQYLSTADAIERYMETLNAGVTPDEPPQSSFFKKIAFYKKGTLHLTFKDDDVLRKFNIIACKGKEWLPDDYGRTPYGEYDRNNQDLVNSFEDRKTYDANLSNLPAFAKVADLPLLASA